jgi:hypothetical protein
MHRVYKFILNVSASVIGVTQQVGAAVTLYIFMLEVPGLYS